VKLARTTIDDVREALPAESPGLPPREIHARIGYGARGHVHHLLRALVAAGEAAAEGAPNHRRYAAKNREA